MAIFDEHCIYSRPNREACSDFSYPEAFRHGIYISSSVAGDNLENRSEISDDCDNCVQFSFAYVYFVVVIAILSKIFFVYYKLIA